LGRREKKREATRQEILTAASKFFQERGFDETSVDDIAEAADVAKGTFYYHFKSKDDVLIGLSMIYLNKLSASIDQLLETDRSPLAILREMLHNMSEETQANRAMAQKYYSAVFSQFSRQFEIEYRDDPAILSNIITRVVVAAQNAGEIRKDRNGGELGLIIAGQFHHAQVTWLSLGEDRTLSSKVDQWFDILLEGVGNHK
jgi:AcrR family transcriptional regulator